MHYVKLTPLFIILQWLVDANLFNKIRSPNLFIQRNSLVIAGSLQCFVKYYTYKFAYMNEKNDTRIYSIS